ncbi:unnamed protein product [Prunus armeniaca]
MPGLAKAPFSRSDLEYLRRYFTVTPTYTIFGLTTEEKARVSRLDDYFAARDALAKARQALEEEVETSDPPKTKATTYDTPGTARPMAKGPGNLFFGHDAWNNSALGISDEDCEGILGMIEEKTLTSGSHEVNKEAGRGNQREPKEVSMNMVLVLPSEFSAPRGQTNCLDNDVVEEQLDQRPKTKEELLAVAFNEDRHSGHGCNQGARPNEHGQVGIITPGPSIFIDCIAVSPWPHKKKGHPPPRQGRNLSHTMALAHVDFPRRRIFGGQQEGKNHLDQATMRGSADMAQPWFWRSYKGEAIGAG